MAFKKLFYITTFILCSLFIFSTTCLACTGVYVGSGASDDGTIMIARSNDKQTVCGNHVTVTPRVENEPGRTMPLNIISKTSVELPETTFRYTATPFMDSAFDAIANIRHDAAACANEYGVVITSSVTAFSNDAALKADPLVEAGLAEDTMSDLVICQSRTAREAVDVLLSLIDTYGSSESNIVMIADQTEAWYVEIYTGYQYAAVKLPDDQVSVFGNEYTMEYLSDYEEYRISDELLRLPEEKGFAAYGDNGELNLFDTYSGASVRKDYCHMRTWIGHQVLAPSVYSGDYDAEIRYPLTFTPDQKVSLTDVCRLMRNRFEGTDYDPDRYDRTDSRVIGTDTALSVHVLQVYPELPAEMACVTWESTGPAVYGIFVPVSNAMTAIKSAYGKDQPAEEKGIFDTEHYPYYAYKGLCTLCVERSACQTYGEPVRDYWTDAEELIFAGMPRILDRASKMKDRDSAADYLTAYCTFIQDQAFSDAKSLLNAVMWTQSSNSNTMKTGINPETGEVLDPERLRQPMSVTLDPTAYDKWKIG